MTKSQKKFLIILAIVLTLWRIVGLAAVEDAFLQFIAVGQIPGTYVFLSPKSVFLLLAGIFSLSLMLIFRREIAGSFRRHREAHAQRDTAVQPHASAQNVSDPHRIITISRPRNIGGVALPALKLNVGDRKLPALYVPPVMPSVWRLIDLEMQLIAIVWRHIKTATLFVWKIASKFSIRAWRWAEPHIRRWDKKIEKKLRKNHATSEIIEVIEECWRAIIDRPRRPEQNR